MDNNNIEQSVHPKGRWQPGQSGNKGGGIPKEMRLSTWIDKALDKELPNTVPGWEEGMTVRKQIAKLLVDGVILTNNPTVRLDYLKEILDRTEGKAKQVTVVENPDGTGIFEKATYKIDI